ncbi:hypothetical protein [Pseudobacteriovorax antillogorgiicola]|uniref:MORN repeat-containing protein n=1 Tax=Pseudobacteriovorax antillogorgiicola TaxID=1513793 RepID=A0A1Y6BM64_9BACT|nr:hypothetical protein [Pseudobacteriovorax antillogorgiicola]TCS54601.1 hypothetical protein EDD56_106114 [Pseudobacteriovorax antillogorgiicola]SMF17639.1 hypothetical protein SAMN06296036_106129 [Pseudobacteriovorax antillogorgiicola]
MKSVIIRAFFAFYTVLTASSAMADFRGDANRLLDITENLRSKININFVKSTPLTDVEDRIFNEILPTIDERFIAAGEFFNDAAIARDSTSAGVLVQSGLNELKEARSLIYEGRWLANQNNISIADIFDELLLEIEEAEKIIEDSGLINPWLAGAWDIRYTNPSGKWINGTMTFSGSDAEYRTDGGSKGRFTKVDFENDNRRVEGLWRFQNGATGWYQFYLNNDGESFSGKWGNGSRIGKNKKGHWNGSLK